MIRYVKTGRLFVLCAAAALVSGCAEDSWVRGAGLRLGTIIPGAGETMDYDSAFMLGGFYGRPIDKEGRWSWEAGLDYSGLDSEDGNTSVRLGLARFDLRTDLITSPGEMVHVYLFWGGQLCRSDANEFDVDSAQHLEAVNWSGAFTAGVGLRLDKAHTDLRLTGMQMMGGGNVGVLLGVTAGVFF